VASPLALYLLGLPRIERGGVPVEVNRRKAVALVAYLAVTGQGHPRDSLVNLLWPEYDSSRGRAALRRTLFTLRTALGEDAILVDRDQLGLDPSGALRCDVDEFHRYLAACGAHGHPTSETCPRCVPPLTEAVSLFRGEFMSGFTLRDSVNFDDWQLFQAERIRRELDSALQRLVQWHSAQREFELAAGYARRRLALDPLDEGAHCQLMRLCAWSGRRSAALRQYQECVAILEDQLGVPPQQATTQLYQAIQAGRAPPPPDARQTPESVPESQPCAEPPPFLQQDIPVETPIFVARERELAQLDQFLQQALDGHGRVVFVTGEAGTGKTALIQEFARRALDSYPGLVVAAGHSNAHTGVGDPYLPFREILGQLTGDVEALWAAGAMTREQACRLWSALPLTSEALVETGPELIETFLLPGALLRRARAVASGSESWLIRLADQVEQKPVTRAGISGPQQSDLFEQYTRVLQTLAHQEPLLLIVDDLQWADLGSISLLFHLGRQLAGSRILIVGAYRLEEIALGRTDPWSGSGQRERHPVEPVVHELQRELGDITVDLGQAESRDFVEALLDSEPNRLGHPFREMLYRQTQGHPLFTVELLRGLQEQGDLVQDWEGYWIEGTTLDWERLPARVEAVIAERIGRLAQPLRAALRVASVEGEEFTAEVVARVRAIDEQRLLARLSSELDRRHRLVRAQSIQRLAGQLVSRYRFRHILFQRFLYNSLDEVERVHLHNQVGTALEDLVGMQEHDVATTDLADYAPQLARHFQEARNSDKAISYLLRAGERAVRLSAYQEGRAHLTKGLELLLALPDSPERARRELALQIALGIASKAGIPDPEMEQPLNRARALCQQVGETRQLSQIVGELSIYAYVRAEHQRARQLTEEALSLAEQANDPLLEMLGHWHLGYVLFALGEFAESHVHLQRVISSYDPEQHHRSFVFLRGSDAGVGAMAYEACCLWCLGFPEQAYARSQKSLALARTLGHAFTLVDVLCYAGCVFDEMRYDVPSLERHAEELMQASDRLGVASFAGTGLAHWGHALTTLGQVQEGLARLREGLASRQSVGALCNSSALLDALAEAQAAAGEPEEALHTLDGALAFVEETGERYYEAALHRRRGALLLAQGDHANAEASLRKAIEVARRQSAKSWELRATTSLARLWQRQGRADEARQVLSEVFAWFTEGFDSPDLKAAKALLAELAQANEGLG
jgi:predicted ATPase/DNA-binding SARP family transcriptional activator/predicted negative regulator of RcsB-dependent stress response